MSEITVTDGGGAIFFLKICLPWKNPYQEHRFAVRLCAFWRQRGAGKKTPFPKKLVSKSVVAVVW